MKCIRIGFGNIARIHEEQLKQHGVQTIGILEINPERVQALRQAGFRAVESIQEAVSLNPNFYDVCTPTSTRLEILRQLCELDAHANILIEKPICDFQDIDQVRLILQQHLGRIVVNENYASSNVTAAVQKELTTRGIIPSRLIVEFTKNRSADFLAGRFIDTRLGALGYEGSHLLALVGEFGQEYEISKLLNSDVDSININRPETSPQEAVYLLNQGGAYMKYEAKNGCLVEMYSSMAGRIGFPCPPYAQPAEVIEHGDATTRYRILRVDGVNEEGTVHQIVGLFEPVKDLRRSQGILLTFKDRQLESPSGTIEDNTMSQHLVRAMHFFRGSADNPYSFERGLNDVQRLHDWFESGQSENDKGNEKPGLLERMRE